MRGDEWQCFKHRVNDKYIQNFGYKSEEEKIAYVDKRIIILKLTLKYGVRTKAGLNWFRVSAVTDSCECINGPLSFIMSEQFQDQRGTLNLEM